MLIAMALASVLCIGIGVWPTSLFYILPFEVNYIPYTDSHVLSQIQLLFFSALSFTVLIKTGLYPTQSRSTILDTDWIYRRLATSIVTLAARVALRLQSNFFEIIVLRARRVVDQLYKHHGPQGVLARTWPTGSMVLWVAIFLGIYLLLYFIKNV